MKLLERVKNKLEEPEKGVATATARLLDLLILTYAVPVERVKGLLPDGLSPDRLPGPDGELLAFIQTTCAYHEDERWSPTPKGIGDSYHEVTYRILTRREGKRGAFILRRDVSSDEAHVAGRAVAKEVDFVRVSVHINGNPVRGNYLSYTLRAVGDCGKTECEVRPLSSEDAGTVPVPFGSVADMATFLTGREELYYVNSFPGGNISLTPLTFSVSQAEQAQLASARLSLWTDKKLLTPEEVARPHSVLLQPSLTMTTLAPRLAKLK